MAHLLVVVSRQYNGHELWTALGVLQERGHTFDIVSTAYEIEDEVTHQRNTIEHVLDDVPHLNGHEGLMFISGNMKDTEAYWKDSRALRYVSEAVEQDIPIAAICCSVPTIREAVKGKQVSYFPLLRSTEILRNAGAKLSTVSVSADGKLVTAEHQMATQLWAETFGDVLDGKQPKVTLVDSKFRPPNRLRRNKEVERLIEIAKNSGKQAF
jgi:putative intracellular protease/amidase